jgi:hypothetical protein
VVDPLTRGGGEKSTGPIGRKAATHAETLGVAVDDAAAPQQVMNFIDAVGFEPVFIGTPSTEPSCNPRRLCSALPTPLLPQRTREQPLRDLRPDPLGATTG